MFAESSYFYVNTDELVDFPRPISHKVIQIGGMGVRKSLAKRGKLEKVRMISKINSLFLEISRYFRQLQTRCHFY
jgi:hypothetical protein